MSTSTRRRCALCTAPAYGPNGNGRMRLGGRLTGEQIRIATAEGFRTVQAGRLTPVCESHRLAILSARDRSQSLAERHGAELRMMTSGPADPERPGTSSADRVKPAGASLTDAPPGPTG